MAIQEVNVDIQGKVDAPKYKNLIELTEEVGGYTDRIEECEEQVEDMKDKILYTNDEDITVDNEKNLILADKQYDAADYSGLGRVYLRKNMIVVSLPFDGFLQTSPPIVQSSLDDTPDSIFFDVPGERFVGLKNYRYYINWQNNEGYRANLTDGDLFSYDNKYYEYNEGTLAVKENPSKTNVLTQAMINKANTIYHIQYDYNLNGAEITVPEGCVLEFNGGKLRNGELLFRTDTLVDAKNVQIFDNVSLSAETPKGNAVKYKIKSLNVAWFGAVGDGVTDNYAKFQKAIDCAFNFGCPVVLPKGRYNISQTLELYKGSVIIGNSDNLQYSNNNANLTLLNYSGNAGTSCIHVTDGSFIVLKNFGITNTTSYVCDGFTFDGSLLHTEIDNFNIYGCRYGIHGIMTGGFSTNFFSRLVVTYCIKGIFIESQTISEQYVTLNMIEQLTIGSIKENAIYISAKTINSLKFIDCNIHDIGAGTSYDTSTSESNHSGVVLEQSNQGSVCFENCYFENIIYSPDTSVIPEYDYTKDAIVSISDMSCTMISCRFANTLQIIKAKGNNNILLENCIDYGFNILMPYTAIINVESGSKIIINGYDFRNNNKDVIYGALNSSNVNSSILINGLKWKNNKLEKSTTYDSEDTVHFYVGTSVGSGIVSEFPISPFDIYNRITNKVLKFIIEYVDNVISDSGKIFTNTKGGKFIILGNNYKQTITNSASSYAALYDVNGFRKVYVSNLIWEGLNEHPYFIRTNSNIVATFNFTNIVISSLAANGYLLVMSAETNIQHLEIVNVNNQSGLSLTSCNSCMVSTDVFNGNQAVTKNRDINFGPTAIRPVTIDIGHNYFDVTLNKPITWTGSRWLDSQGYTAAPHKGTTTQRNALVLNASTDIGFDFYDTTLGVKLYAGAIDSNGAVTRWLDEEGYTPLPKTATLNSSSAATYLGTTHADATSDDIGMEVWITDNNKVAYLGDVRAAGSIVQHKWYYADGTVALDESQAPTPSV